MTISVIVMPAKKKKKKIYLSFYFWEWHYGANNFRDFRQWEPETWLPSFFPLKGWFIQK